MPSRQQRIGPEAPPSRIRSAAGLLLVLAATALVALLVVRATRTGVRDTGGTGIADAQYVGSDTCATCHATQNGLWRTSQHERAMAHASPDRVLGDFSDATFTAGGETAHFFRRDDEFWVRTDGADGTPADFRVRYTFGVDPMQQYLIEFPDGRIQALSVAWDTRPATAGGQRWFHLYGDTPPSPGDELHWTGRQQNWNFMCADCHSTNVRKNYDVATDRFATTWSAINVGCEACHGPGSAHARWARTSPWMRALRWRDDGLTVALTERVGVTWSPDLATLRPTRSTPRTTDAEVTTCAPCHSRRAQVAEGYRPGLPLSDFYTPATLTPGLFYVDGQQQDEVYTHASFQQSRMNHAGVTCSDCHDPHSAQLRAPGNTLCAQCHQPSQYDSPAHHRHPARTAGTSCVACHMPERTYMQIDPRRDHSLRVPRPDLSVSLGVPNACSSCHTNETNQWAADRVREWYGRDARGSQTFADIFHADETNGPDAATRLATTAGDPAQPPIVRASALDRLSRRPSEVAVASASAAMDDASPDVRLAAVRVAEGLAPRQRLALAGAALVDPVLAVRLEAARLLAPAGGAVANAEGVNVLDRAAEELRASLRLHADRPESRNAMAGLLAAQGRVDEAVAEYRASLALAPDVVATYINLADLFGQRRRESEAESTLRQGLAALGPRADLQHALGLSLVRAGRRAEALVALDEAARLAPAVPRFSYALAVALHSTGQGARAIQVLDQLLARHPGDRDSLFALATFHRDAGRRAEARAAAERLVRSWPDDLDARALLESLR
jgi:predicted CXXCH cytochrome family protein